jgi:tRNA splicing endonuclease
MKSQINWNNKIIEIQIIISIVRVSENFSKMLVLSGVFNTKNFEYYMNYTNQDYVHVNYTLIVIYSMLLVTGSKSKKHHVAQ